MDKEHLHREGVKNHVVKKDGDSLYVFINVDTKLESLQLERPQTTPFLSELALE